MPSQPSLAALRGFYCEHTPSKSRILALVDHPAGPPSLQAVLTCRRPELAYRAALMLQRAIRSSADTWDIGPVEELCIQLPDAPAASLRNAVDHALVGSWPTAVDRCLRWEQIPRDRSDGVGKAADAEGDDAERHASHTPQDARLIDLAGPVIRVTLLREFHVHDQQAVLKAATDEGWEPLPADDLLDDDPQDLVGAAMWLAELGEIEGADTITDDCQGMRLRTEAGHEVAEWSPAPVVADFGPGWRHGAAARPARPDKQSDDEEVPDFAVLFKTEPPHCEDPECEDERCLWQLTPRTADVLYTALCVLADQAYDDAEEIGDSPLVRGELEGNWGVFTQLPKLTFRADLQWRRRFARAVDDLADDLEHGRWPQPTCTAEELALHLAIGDARDRVDELDDADEQEKLPAHRDDFDLDMCSEVFFQDTDVLMLYSDRFDGIEDPDGDANRELGVGDLRTAAWFDPFQNVPARDPHRGFRR